MPATFFTTYSPPAIHRSYKTHAAAQCVIYANGQGAAAAESLIDRGMSRMAVDLFVWNAVATIISEIVVVRSRL